MDNLPCTVKTVTKYVIAVNSEAAIKGVWAFDDYDKANSYYHKNFKFLQGIFGTHYFWIFRVTTETTSETISGH